MRLDALEVDPGSVLIPESKTNNNPDSIKEELLKILFNIVEDKKEDDIRTLLNINNVIFRRFKRD